MQDNATINGNEMFHFINYTIYRQISKVLFGLVLKH